MSPRGSRWDKKNKRKQYAPSAVVLGLYSCWQCLAAAGARLVLELLYSK